MINRIQSVPGSTLPESPALRFSQTPGQLPSDGLGPLPTSTAELSFGNINAVQGRNVSSLSPNSVSFGSGGGTANDDKAIGDLKRDFVKNGRVGLSKMNALDTKVDSLLKSSSMRAALIERYDLNSAANRKALMAVGTMESGGNGDMGETMTATINRALVQNMMSEITGKSDRTSIREVVNQKNQYESAPRVNAVINGGRTHQNWNAYKGEAGQLADAIFDGKSSFKQDASDIYYFRAQSFGRSTEFKIGKHNFDDTLNRQTYVQEGLRLARGINHNA